MRRRNVSYCVGKWSVGRGRGEAGGALCVLPWLVSSIELQRAYGGVFGCCRTVAETSVLKTGLGESGGALVVRFWWGGL